MKAITVQEPWATLLAIGEKRFETRSWKTNYRGRIAIHASKAMTGEGRALVRDSELLHAAFERHKINPFTGRMDDAYPHPSFDSYEWGGLARDWPATLLFTKSRGRVIAVGSIKDCIPTEEVFRRYRVTVQERRFGDFSPGRYAWLLEYVTYQIVPIAWKGGQGLWTFDYPPGSHKHHQEVMARLKKDGFFDRLASGPSSGPSE